MKVVFLYSIATIFVAMLIIGCKVANTKELPKSIIVGSYNIRYAADADEKTGNNWDKRKYLIVKIIEDYNFDIVGTQEANKKQKNEVENLLKTYFSVAHPYGGKSGDGHHTITYFKKDRFSLLDSGVFWLSETPNQPSVGWDASDRRICQWLKLKDLKSKKILYFFNAHFYWRAQTAKLNSGPLIVNQIKAIAGNYPSILVGDLNSEENTPQIHSISRIMRDVSKIEKDEVLRNWYTNLGGGNFQDPLVNRIDYIFISDAIKPYKYHVIKDKYADDRYPSDHLPIYSELLIK